MTAFRTPFTASLHAVACALALHVSAPTMARAEEAIQFDIASQPLVSALKAFAEQADIQLLYKHEAVEHVTANAVVGKLDKRAALEQLLRGTQLEVVFISESAATIRPIGEKISRSTSIGSLRLAQTDSLSPSQGEGRNEDGWRTSGEHNIADPDRSLKRVELEEVVVTGTHIRGQSSSASPVSVYTKADIELAGVGSVHEFVQRLPQNFNGGASEHTIAGVTGGAGGVNNTVSGTGVNLRGLGNAATLVLLNGHRIAPGNTAGDFVDISMIPMSAIERIEVIPDGASAIYGSDAVGGVINFILRQDFEGAETRASYGSVTEGSHHQFNVSQTFGNRWESGSALLSYDYFDQTPLSAADRPFTAQVPLPFTLLPRHVRNSVLLNLTQDVSSNVELFADAMYSHRTTSTYINNAPAYALHSLATISAYGGTVGARFELPRNVLLELKTGYSSSNTDFEQTYHIASQTFPGAESKSVYDILTVEASANGSLWESPAGDVKFAIGSLYRTEDFDFDNFLTPFRSFSPSRSIAGGFVELHVPVVGSGPDDGIAERLMLTIADRYEHYSDFGSTNNPKIGIVWRPHADLKLRGTYSTSFRAPLLSQLNPLPGQVFPIGVPDPKGGSQPCSPPDSGNSCTNVLLNIGGGNPDLRPEKARSWTVGADFSPSSVAGLQASLTYYRIVFKNLIQFPTSLGGFSNSRILELEDLFGPAIVQRDPDPQVISQLVTGNPSFINPFSIDPYSVGVLFYGASQNLSIATNEGIDLAAQFTKQFGRTNVVTGVEGTYLTKLDKQFVRAAPVVSVLNTPYNPIDLKIRAHASATHGNATVALSLNYLDEYKDDRWPTPRPVSSWTTIDMSVRYDLSELLGFGKEASVLFAVTNLADRAPPFVSNSGSFAGINYDGANADARGRFVRLQVSARF